MGLKNLNGEESLDYNNREIVRRMIKEDHFSENCLYWNF